MMSAQHTPQTICCKRCGQLMPREMFDKIERLHAPVDRAIAETAAERDQLAKDLVRYVERLAAVATKRERLHALLQSMLDEAATYQRHADEIPMWLALKLIEAREALKEL